LLRQRQAIFRLPAESRYTSFEGAPDFAAEPQYKVNDFHWSPEGHAVVAQRLIDVLSAAGVIHHGQ
jgi:hypothetical protein